MCWFCRQVEEAAAAEQRDREAREMTLVAIAWIAERHGLDDYEAARHLRLHAINGPRVWQ